MIQVAPGTTTLNAQNVSIKIIYPSCLVSGVAVQTNVGRKRSDLLVHPMQKMRQDNINLVKNWLKEAQAKNPENMITWKERKEVIQKAMIQFSCSERLAKEYVKIAN